MRKDRWLVGNGEINGKITDGERAEAREICRLQLMAYENNYFPVSLLF